jgi:hypothetical protein
VAGKPSYWPGRVLEVATTPSGGQGYRLQWLEEVAEAAQGGAKRYRLGGAQTVSVKSILVEDFVVQQISDDLFEISVDVGTELQNIFDAVMKVPPVEMSPPQTPQMPITNSRCAEPRTAMELRMIAHNGNKRHLVLHMLRIYHMVLAGCYNNRARIFGSTSQCTTAAGTQDNFSFYM